MFYYLNISAKLSGGVDTLMTKPTFLFGAGTEICQSKGRCFQVPFSFGRNRAQSISGPTLKIEINNLVKSQPKFVKLFFNPIHYSLF